MKKVLFLLLIIFSKESVAQKHTFIRIYDSTGKMISNGKLVDITDSSLTLQRMNKTVTLRRQDMHMIKTRHTYVHRFIVPALIGGSIFAVLGASSSNPDALILNKPAEGAILGGSIGISLGSVFGAVMMLFKKTETFNLLKNKTDWERFEIWANKNK